MPSKLKRVVKREVVTVKEGRSLGQPANILIDPEQHRVSLVVLTYGAVPDTSLVVPASAVQSFDADALAVDSLDSLVIAGRDDETLRLLARGEDFRRRPVLTSQGEDMGRLDDAMVDESGRVTEYRLQKGTRGRIMPTVKVAPGEVGTLGVEVAVVTRPGRAEAGPPEQGLAGGKEPEEQEEDR